MPYSLKWEYTFKKISNTVLIKGLKPKTTKLSFYRFEDFGFIDCTKVTFKNRKLYRPNAYSILIQIAIPNLQASMGPHYVPHKLICTVKLTLQKSTWFLVEFKICITCGTCVPIWQCFAKSSL